VKGKGKGPGAWKITTMSTPWSVATGEPPVADKGE
jgi:hypothetical protein